MAPHREHREQTKARAQLATSDVATTSRGKGLTNMEDRLDALGGTTLRAAIPVRQTVPVTIWGHVRRSGSWNKVVRLGNDELTRSFSTCKYFDLELPGHVYRATPLEPSAHRPDSDRHDRRGLNRRKAAGKA
jgi:hypothetical protein